MIYLLTHLYFPGLRESSIPATRIYSGVSLRDLHPFGSTIYPYLFSYEIDSILYMMFRYLKEGRPQGHKDTFFNQSFSEYFSHLNFRCKKAVPEATLCGVISELLRFL